MAKRAENGNSIASQAAYVRELVKSSEVLLRFEETWDHLAADDFLITHIRIIHPGITSGEYKVVVKATIGDKKVVAFHNGRSLLDVLQGMCNRLENNTLQFREDQYG